jgi:hypothetical protein
VTRAWTPVLLWGCFLAVLAALQAVFSARDLQIGVALGVAAAVLLIAALVAARQPSRGTRLLPESSYATVMTAVGIVMVVLGLIFGLWLILIGAGVLALGLGGLVREMLAARRSAS